MAIHNPPEERQIIKLLEKLALPESVRATWVEQIQSDGLNEELAEQIHQRLTTPQSDDPHIVNRASMVLQYTQLVRRWRLVQGAKKFH
jgi:hypothetical protein